MSTNIRSLWLYVYYNALFYFVGLWYYCMHLSPQWSAFLLWDIGVHRVQSAGETGANLLDIRQKLDTSAQDWGADTDREEGRQAQTSHEVFCRMQRQLNDCVRHHQLIIE
jgi:hypothetical protein